MEEKATVYEAITEIRSKVEEVLKDNTMLDRDKRSKLEDIYLEARDYKSDGHLCGKPIYEIMKYDAQAIMYPLNESKKF